MMETNIAIKTVEQKPHDKVSKKKPSYNRSTVKIEDFLYKDIKYINAKQLRVLLPAMFQKMMYPDKDINKTKVKDIWKSKNQPSDFPSGLVFRDPNNAKKMVLEEMRMFFCYLREKLLYRLEYSEQSAKNTLREDLMPSKSGFHVITENYDSNGGFSVDKQDEVQSEIEVMNTEEPETFVSDPSINTSHTAGIQPLPKYSLGSNYIDQDTGALSSHLQKCSDDSGSQVIQLVVADDGTGMSKTISVPATEVTDQLMPLQEVTSDVSTGHVDRCKCFASETYSAFSKQLEQFCKTYMDNRVVLESIKKIHHDVISPLYEEAQSGDKYKCLELSSTAIYLLDIMKRSTFLAPNYDPIEELQELENLISSNDKLEHTLPSAATEVQTTSTEDTYQPVLTVTKQSNLGELLVMIENSCISSNKELVSTQDNWPSSSVENLCNVFNNTSQLTEKQHEVDAERDLKIVINRNVAADCRSSEDFSSRMETENAIPVVPEQIYVETNKTNCVTKMEGQCVRGNVCSTVPNIPSVVSEVAEMFDDGCDGPTPPKQKRTSYKHRGRKGALELRGRRCMNKEQMCCRLKCGI